MFQKFFSLCTKPKERPKTTSPTNDQKMGRNRTDEAPAENHQGKSFMELDPPAMAQNIELNLALQRFMTDAGDSLADQQQLYEQGALPFPPSTAPFQLPPPSQRKLDDNGS